MCIWQRIQIQHTQKKFLQLKKKLVKKRKKNWVKNPEPYNKMDNISHVKYKDKDKGDNIRERH